MADHTEVIRKEMQETRSHLADKLEALETQVSETVQSTTTMVSETVEAVKETVGNVTATVQETVQAVGDTFNVRRHTERHPWMVFGGSVALGCLAAHLLKRQPGETPTRNGHAVSTPEVRATVETRPREAEAASQATTRSESSGAGEKSWFRDTMSRLGGLAVGSMMGVVRDLAVTGLPGVLGKRVAEEVDHLTPKLGGEIIQGPVIPTDN